MRNIRVSKPSRLATWLVWHAMPESEREGVVGDLAEEYAERCGERGARLGDRAWYWRQALDCTRAGLSLRWRGNEQHGERRRKEGMMSGFVQDVRYAFRAMRRNVTFSLVVVATLGLGIAANTIVFSTVDGVVLNPFPFPDGDRLVGVGTQYPRLGGELQFWENLSPAEYLDIAEGVKSLEGVVAWDMGNRSISFGDATENLFSAFWWGDAFPTLGMQPAAGRGFTEEEIREGHHVAILSHRVWRGRFGGDPSVVGGTILMNGEPYTVVGIMPPRALIYGTDLWLPMPVAPSVFPRDRRQFQVLARLAAGVTLEQANAELSTVAGRVAQQYGGEFEEYEGWRMTAMPWRDVNVRMLKPAAAILLGAVTFLLLLVVANVASLMLSRGWARNREIAVRAALGAGKRRILSQLLTESVVLAIAGGVIGILLGSLGVNAVSNLLRSLALPIAGEIAMSGRVLGFTALVSVMAGLVFGAAPALHASRFDLQRTLQAESLAVVGNRSRLRMQRVLVGVEVALALAILAGSALLVRSFLLLQRVDPGFESGNVLTMRLTLAQERYTSEALEPFFQELRERVSAIPGVVSVATTSQFPPNAFQQRQLQIEGREAAADAALPVAFTTLVSPAYFDVLRMQVVRGRSFTEADRAESPTVIVINAAAASRFFRDSDPVGQRIRLGEDGRWLQVVGVVNSARNRGIDLEPAPELFASTLQLPGLSNQMFLMIRTEREPLAILSAVRQAVAAIDPRQPVYAIRTLDQVIAATQVTRRVSLITLTLFGIFALILAGVGIYGVVANAVSQRTRELGLRMALGAARGQVRSLVVRQALVPVVFGTLAGLAGAWGLGRAMNSLLFGVGGSDPAALIGAGALMAGVAFFATYLPARRASRLDPMRALRIE